MTRIIYPENDTITNLVKNPLNDALKALLNAQNNCSFLIPSDFAYVEYVRTLGSKIYGYRRKLVNIYSDISMIDRRYTGTFEEIDSLREKIDVSTIDERERLVK